MNTAICRVLAVVWCAALAGACATPEVRPSDRAEFTQAASTEADRGADRGVDWRAMWLWSEEPSAREVLEDRDGAQQELFAFMRAPHGDPAWAINRLFFEARGYDKSDRYASLREVTYDPLREADAQQKLRRFLRRAHDQGVAVEYLDGQAIWLASDENARVPKQICRDVVAFNLAADDRRERFDGVHLDIEPHTVTEGPHAGDWWRERLDGGYNARWTARWQDILTTCRDVFDAYEETTGHHLTLAADLGADFAYYNEPMHAFFDRKAAPTDYVVLMNYYDNRPNRDDEPSFFFGADDGEAVVGGVEQNLELWKTTPIVFAAETGPETIAADERSFHQEGHAKLYETLGKVVENYGATNCRGVAIHHYSPDAYRDLQP